MERHAGLRIERHREMELLLVLFGHRKALSFHGVDMNHSGSLAGADLAERLDQRA